MIWVETSSPLDRMVNAEQIAYIDVDSEGEEWTLDATMTGCGRSFKDDLPHSITLQRYGSEEAAKAGMAALLYLIAAGSKLIKECEYYAGPNVIVEMDFDGERKGGKLRRIDRRGDGGE